jgi:hypothetical protein
MALWRCPRPNMYASESKPHALNPRVNIQLEM